MNLLFWNYTFEEAGKGEECSRFERILFLNAYILLFDSDQGYLLILSLGCCSLRMCLERVISSSCTHILSKSLRCDNSYSKKQMASSFTDVFTVTLVSWRFIVCPIPFQTWFVFLHHKTWLIQYFAGIV